MALGEATDSVREKIKTPMPRLTQSRVAGGKLGWGGAGRGTPPLEREGQPLHLHNPHKKEERIVSHVLTHKSQYY